VQAWYSKTIESRIKWSICWVVLSPLAASLLFPDALLSHISVPEKLFILATTVPVIALFSGSRGRAAVFSQGFYPEFAHTPRQVRQLGSRWVPWADVKRVYHRRLGGWPTLRIVVSRREVYFWRVEAGRRKDDDALVGALLSSWHAYGGKLEGEGGESEDEPK
jgi:hypothetical protein